MPGGRPPKERSFAAALNIEIKREAEKDVPKMRKIAEKLVEKAMEGDMAAIREVADRIDGKAIQQNINENTHNLGEPLQDLLESIAKNGTNILKS